MNTFEQLEAMRREASTFYPRKVEEDKTAEIIEENKRLKERLDKLDVVIMKMERIEKESIQTRQWMEDIEDSVQSFRAIQSKRDTELMATLKTEMRDIFEKQQEAVDEKIAELEYLVSPTSHPKASDEAIVEFIGRYNGTRGADVQRATGLHPQALMNAIKRLKKFNHIKQDKDTKLLYIK